MDKMPFAAALFDLDGTLLDSLGVWRRVDKAFFGVRHIAFSSDEYSHAVQGMSFREAAEYTVSHYNLDDGVDALMDEWKRMSAEEYALRVPLKPFAREYLRMLKRAGVKLAVVTANRPDVFMPTLERGGVLELFDVICTTAEVDDVGKGGGELFLLAARKLDVMPMDCAVFEDTLEGIRGARRAGMRAYAVLDALTRAHHEELSALADGAIVDFHEMCRYHPFPENPRRCVIITAHCEGDPHRAWRPMAEDRVLCADGGWELARQMGVTPELVIGDFDSSDAPEDLPVLRVPQEKDDTDTMLCLKHGLSEGYDDFLIVGGFGGRMDHTFANLQTLHYAASRGVRCEMRDGQTCAAAVRNGSLRLPAAPGKLSVFALSDTCLGVTIRGARYAVEGVTLTNTFPLGVSNEFTADFAEIGVAEGTLLIVWGEQEMA